MTIYERHGNDIPNFAEKDACELLDADHIAVKHLFVDYARLAFASNAGATESQRTALAMKICDEVPPGSDRSLVRLAERIAG